MTSRASRRPAAEAPQPRKHRADTRRWVFVDVVGVPYRWRETAGLFRRGCQLLLERKQSASACGADSRCDCSMLSEIRDLVGVTGTMVGNAGAVPGPTVRVACGP